MPFVVLVLVVVLVVAIVKAIWQIALVVGGIALAGWILYRVGLSR